MTRPSSRSPVALLRLTIVCLAVACLAAGCGFFTSEPVSSPTAAPSPSATTKPTPTPLPYPVGTITLAGGVGESEPGSRSTLAWQGIQEAGAALGAATSLVSPLTAAELAAAVPTAAAIEAPAGATVVVTVGPAGARAALGAALEHPSTVFFVLDEPVADDAPANVHGLVFDDTEAGYLAGVVAGSVSATGAAGFVAGARGDPAAAGYLAGLQNGVRQAIPAATLGVAYAGSAQDPQKGRAALDGLVKGGATAIVAMPDLTGYGAMRQACVHNVPVVALATEAALLLPDVRPCLAVSILRRYDVAVRDAITGYATGRTVPRLAIGTVASGGIAPGPFANPVPPAVAANLEGVLAAMRAGPPRPTPAPTVAPTPGSA